MTVQPKTGEIPAETGSTLRETMLALGREAKAAARVLALAPTAQKDRALAAMAVAIRADKNRILAANAKDMTDGQVSGDRKSTRLNSSH